MFWAMMRFYLLSIALVFCGYTDGFNVWNRTSILDWQAGRSNVTWSQTFQLATPGQFELPSRKGPNGNDGRGNFGNAVLTSEVQPVQRDSSFVQSSGGVAHIKQILNAYGQATPSHQPNDAPQSSRFYWNEFIKPGNCGPLPSQHWPAKTLPGFQSPSSFQPAGTINQVSESGAQSYQPNSTPVSANLFSSMALPQSSSQSVVSPNQISESQLPYQISVSTSQSDSTAQPQGSNRTKSSETAKWYRLLQGKMIPSSSQTQLYQPSSPTQLCAGQSASTFQAQGPSASTPYQGQALSWHVSQDQSIPSSQSVVTTNPTQSSYQPKIQTLGLAGQSDLLSHFLGASNLYQDLTSGKYLALLGQNIPSSQSVVTTSQITDAQAQSFQPSPITQALAGQSAISQDQSLQASAAYPLEVSGWYTTSQGQKIPSSLQVSGFQAQSFQPSPTTQALSGQSAAQVQSIQASTSNIPQTSGWYTILLGKMIPSSQVSGVQTGLLIPPSSTQGFPGPSASTAPLQPLDASTLYQMQGSSMYSTSQNQSNPLSSQPVATTNQISGLQNTYWPNTPASSSQTISLPQSSSASQLFQGQTSGMSSISQDQSIPSSSQSVDTSSQVLMGQSASAQDKSLQASYPPQTSGWYTILQGQIPSPSQVSGFQAQSSCQPSTTTQVMPGQSVSSQSMGVSALYQALTSGRYLTSLGQNIPPSPQPVATTNQMSGLQNTYWPNTPASSSQTISLPQSSSASQMFQGQTSGMSSISQDQSIPSSSQSVDTTSQITSSQTQSSFQPSTTTVVLTEQSALVPAQSLGNSHLCSSQTPSWYTTLGKLIPSSQMSGFQTALQQPSSKSQPAAASQAQSMGDSPLYQGLTSNLNLTSQYQRTPSSFQSVAALNQISGIQYQSTYWPNTIQLAPSQSAFIPPSQSSGVAPMYQVPAEGLPNTSQDQSITASLQSVPSTNQISGLQNQTSYWPSATWVLPGDSRIAPTQSLGNSVSYPSQTSGWYTFLQSKIPSSQVSGFQAPSLYQPSTTQILAGQSDLSRYNTSQERSSPSYFPSVATNQISGAVSQPSFQPSSTTVGSASKPPISQAQSSGASAWYQGPTFGSLTAQSQNIPSSSQSVVPTNQFSRFQNLMFQPNTAQALSQSASTPHGAPQKMAGITFQGTLPQLSRYGKKWPVTQ